MEARSSIFWTLSGLLLVGTLVLLSSSAAIGAQRGRTDGGLLGRTQGGTRPAGPGAQRGAQRGGQAGRGGQARPGRAEALPEELRELGAKYFLRADYNTDGWISFREARESMQIDRDRFAVFDADRDGRITPDEFQVVYEAALLRYGSFKPPTPAPGSELAKISADEAEAELEREPAGPPPTSINDLFGRPVPRREFEDSTLQPARIVGPVPVFRRLDLDADGCVTPEELEELLRPTQLTIRMRAIVAQLDLDGDGGIGKAEFRASMRHAPK